MNSVASPTYKHFFRPYKQFIYTPSAERPIVTGKPKEFFYLGTDASKIDFLISSFESGYAPDTLDKALAVLERLQFLETGPEIIIYDSTLGEIALNKLFCYLSSAKYYVNVPLVVEASALDEVDIIKFRKLAFIDEIVFIEKEESQKFIQKTEFLRKIKANAGKNAAVIEMPVNTGFHLSPRALTKRTFDIIFSLFAIILLLPVLALLALLITLESKGPVIYVSKRAGRGYKIFSFFKFRTMILDADKNVEELSHLNEYNAGYKGTPIFFKVTNDPRITRLGMFLRKTSLDELPQLFNVLMGDMSLVGNRPLPLFEAASLTTDEWAARFLAPAGMTGLWQIKKKEQHNMSVEERISLDIAYAYNYNFLYDLWIMANTPSALIQRSNS
ncbi:MAG: sugar transferase [Chitinophagaceae bacterium]